MDEGLYTRTTKRSAGEDNTEDSGVRKKRRRHGDKLHNESTAKEHYGNKLRTGKADNSLSREEKKKINKLRKQGRKAAFAQEAARRAKKKAATSRTRSVAGTTSSVYENGRNTVSSTLSGDGGTYSEENNVAEDVFDSGGMVASGLYSKAKEGVYSAGFHNRKVLDGSKEKASEKNVMKKEFQKKLAQKKAKDAANDANKVSKKFTDKAEDLAGKIAEALKEFAEDHPGIALIILAVLLLIFVISGMLSSCSAMGAGVQNSTIITSYTADDEDILAVEDDYKDLESDLQELLDNVETDHEGYDEYNYYVDEIGHNPYQLAALLTVLFENYKREEVQGMLQTIFDLQYEFYTEEEIETRYTEDEEDPEPYDYYILNIYLINHTLDYVVDELGLDEFQKARYEVLLETFGNKKYLFGEDDPYNVPGNNPGDYEGYHVPGEYLTDEEFARMLQEAESHLGTPYVWGGYSPSGFDCSGFVSWVINHCGNGWNYGRQTANGLRGITGYVDPSEAKPGDLIFFHGTYDTPGCSHVGIYVGNGMMIHAGSPVKYSSINTPYWQNHFDSFGRLP